MTNGGERRGAALGRVDDPAIAELLRMTDERIAAGRAVGLILVALSRVDLVNAAYGRPTGDALIAALWNRIEALAEAHDGMASRLGGVDSGLVVDREQVEVVSAAVSAALVEPVELGNSVARVGSRIGVAIRQPGEDARALLRRAREALLAAKASDGSTLRIADGDSIAPLDVLAVDLHLAMDRGEIDVRFQPQVEIATGRIVGVEALARWDHGAMGAIGADTLFAAAERADLGVQLSDHLQQLVLARAAAWPKALGGLRVALNLTAADVARPGFATLFLSRVDASGFPRGRLTVEITETGLIHDLAIVARLLGELRAAGCRVAIDDFGTGYSSLAYLKALPLDYLKIDKALTRDIDGSPRDRVVVRGVIDIARALGVAVIAEGVETPAQERMLAADGCDYYQGFLTAEPLSETALVRLMEGH